MRRILLSAILLLATPIFAQTPNATATVTVTPALIPAKMAMTPTTASVATGTSVVFTVTLSGTGAVPTGTVQLYNGSTLVAGALGTLAAGTTTCTLTTTGAAPGVYDIAAVYSGDKTYSAGVAP
jgi:hypothetical protein